jgi:hypothetical protein
MLDRLQPERDELMGKTRKRSVRSGSILLLALTVVATTAAQESDRSSAPLALGLSLETLEDRMVASGLEDRLDTLPVRIVVDWATVERREGVFDWSAHDPDIETLHRAGARIVLSLTGTHPFHVPSGGPPSPLEGRSLDGWLAFVRSAVGRFAGRIEAVEIRDRMGGKESGGLDPASYAFVLKSSALAARAEARARGAEIRVAQAPVAAADLDWQMRLWEEDVAAYIDILPLFVEAGSENAGVLQKLRTIAGENVRHPPAAEIRAHVVRAPGADPWAVVEVAIRALAAGVPVALVHPDGPAGRRGEISRWIGGAHSALAAGYAPAPLGSVSFQDERERPLSGATALGAFLSDEEFTTLIFYSAPGPGSDLPQDRMIVGTSFVRNARLIDPMTGRVLRVGSAPLSSGSSGRAIRIATGAYPQAVLFERPAGSAGFDLSPEEIETTRGRELTAEEIIARHQQVEKIQNDRLDRWMARGRIDYHFRFVQGGSTVDVSIDTHYFWERGGELEWEEIDYYINGNLVGWKKFPQIPLIQPEKVITLPLDLTLDRTYVYRFVGREKIGGREAYVLQFQPQDPDAPSSLYRGRVWIDTLEFYRVKVSLIQTQLESPILSNEEVDRFGSRDDAAGNRFWMLDKIDGQQVWNTAGRNFVVRREVTFLDYEINPSRETFEERRGEAYASTHNMMRDTEEGFRYLDREPDGTRTLKEPRTSQWFAAAGAFKDNSTDGVQPFAGANYFNFDVGGKNVQIEALIGGVVNFFTASKPDLAGGKLSATVDAFGSALFFSDKTFFEDEELTEERIDVRGQNLNFRLGVHAAQFVKLNFIGSLTFRQYDENDDGKKAVAAYNEANLTQSLVFVLPENHTQATGGFELEFNRRGYSIVASAGWSARSDWEEWGLFDQFSTSFVSYDPATDLYVDTVAPPLRDEFAKWDVTGFKEWYLPSFQKVRTEVNYLDGSRLDRFSKYEFNLFGDDRLSGFAGSGVRFDRGVIARAGYSFNLFEAIRLDGVVENAWIRDETAFDETKSFTGLGITLNLVGPWKTIISANYGRAMASDIPDLEGEDEFFVLILKLF